MWNDPYPPPYAQRNNFQNQGIYQNNYPPQRITKVNGENGAKAYQLPPNSEALLLDETAPIVWLKTTDGAGYPSLAPYSITPYEPTPPVDVNGLEQRIKRLEEIINGKPDNAGTKRRRKEETESTNDSEC